MRGGKREGAGRPKSDPTVLIRLRLKPGQHQAYTELGGEHWLKNTLDKLVAEKPSNVAKLSDYKKP